MLKNPLLLSIFVLSVFPMFSFSDENDNAIDNQGIEFVPGKKWQEETLTIPSYPKKKNLIKLELPHSRYKYFIDKKSISVGKSDQVARYTVVIQSSSGTKNVFYEGIRCSTKEYRTYVFAINSKKFQSMNDKRWKNIRGAGAYKYRLSLFEFYVCHNSSVRRKASEIVQTLIHPPELNETSIIN